MRWQFPNGYLSRTLFRRLRENLQYKDQQEKINQTTMTSKDNSPLALAAIAAVSSAAMMYFIMRPKGPTASSLTSSSSEEETFDEKVSKLNRVDPELQMAGRAKVQRKVTALYRNMPNATHVIRVALTGGPCAGKSSALAHLRTMATAEGFDVYCAPEVATLIFNCGVLFPNNPDEVYLIQRSICMLQLAIERNLTAIVQATGRPSIIIFDRGMLDGKAYMDDESWARVLTQIQTGSGVDQGDGEAVVKGVTEGYCLKRYDGVIHLVTAADGATKFYKSGKITDDSGNEVVREETPEQAISLDRRIQEVWKKHPRHFIIRNEGSFQQKIANTSEAIMQLARESHPWEYQRAHEN